jgi:hypothetical protein
MPSREVTAKIDFDAVIAAARSASVNWSETLKRIETPIEAHMADNVFFVESRPTVLPMSPELKAKLEASLEEMDLQHRWKHDPLGLMNYLPDRWDVAHWIYKIAEVFGAVADRLYSLASRVEG